MSPGSLQCLTNDASTPPPITALVKALNGIVSPIYERVAPA